MSVLTKFAATAKDKLTVGSKAAMRGAGDAFNRLDELGGEARDTIKDWFEQSPAMGSVREMLRKRADASNKSSESDDAVEDDVVEAEIVAPTASLGDAAHAVQVFGKRSCPWSGRAVRLLEDADIEHQFVELDDPENGNYSSQLVSETKQNTVPYIYVRGEFIGGFNALDEISRLGQLEARINVDKNDSTSRVKVEVAKRPTTDEVAPAISSDHPTDTDA